MVQQTYRGYKKEQVSSLVQATPAPDSQETYQNNQRRTAGIVSSINNLVNAGNTAVAVADKGIKEKAATKGKLEGGSGNESTANEYSWGGEEQQKAYNSVKAELVTRDMPSTIEEYIKNDSEVKKPMDEMSSDERAVVYGRARERYFKEKGIEGSSYQEDANLVANDIQSKHLTVMAKQSTDLRQAKALRNISDMVAADAKSYGGDPVAFEASLNTKFDKFAISVGGTKQAQEAVANGLLASVMSPTPSMEALRYLKSDEAKTRFSSFEGFDQVVKQADAYTTKVQNAYKAEVKKNAESGFYINLSGGAFTSKEDVTGYLDNTNLDPEEKFNLTNKALNYLKTRKGADDIQGAIDNRQYNIVNAQKPEVLEAAFSRNVGSPDELNLRSMNIQQENALVDWVNKGYNVPKWISKFGDSPLNNGDQVAMDSQLKMYSNLKTRLGEKGTGTIFSSETSAKMELWARLRSDTTLAPADRRKTLDEFDKAAQADPITGIVMNADIAKELGEDKLGPKILDFVAEGGSNFISGSDDLQPFFTTSDMTATGSEPSLDYAKNSVMGNYAIYRRAGLSQDDSIARAKLDFQKKNQWVEWKEGSDKNSYIPREFGDGFAENSMKYLENTKALDAIALDENLSVEQVKKKITIQPARDYNSTRKVSVYFDGIEKPIGFTADQFHKAERLLNQSEINKVITESSRRSNNPEFIKQQKQLSAVQSLMKGMSFGP